MPPKKQQQSLISEEKKSIIMTDEVLNWVTELYRPDSYSDEEVRRIYGEFRYIGFNRDLVLSQLREKVGDVKLAIQVVILCALRGPVGASIMRLKSNGKTLIEMGIPASGAKKTDHISCARITSATADLAAFYLKKMNVPKRIEHELPGWLQFPSAGSITMPESLRTLHTDFSRKFSPLIKGGFREDIYQQMVLNSYLDTSLKLFD